MTRLVIGAYLVGLVCLAIAMRKAWLDSKAAEQRALDLLDASDEYAARDRANDVETLRGIARRQLRGLPRNGT